MTPRTVERDWPRAHEIQEGSRKRDEPEPVRFLLWWFHVRNVPTTCEILRPLGTAVKVLIKTVCVGCEITTVVNYKFIPIITGH